MPAASITINGSAGSNSDLPIGTLVQLDNQNTGGELTYQWTFIDQPPGPADSFSNATLRNPTFTPTKEGTYLIELVVNLSLPTEQSQKVIAAVRQLTTGQRIIAAGETTEDGTRGWAAANNANLTAINNLLANPGAIVGVNVSGGVLSTGQIVRVTALATIKPSLPGEQQVAGFDLATSTTVAQVDELLCVVEGAVAGGGTIANGALMNTRYIGIPLDSSGNPQAFAGVATAGDPVYLDDTGALSLTPGTVRRQLGSVANASGPSYNVWFNGVGGAEITPTDAPYVVYGNPGTLTTALRIDGTNAAPVSGGVSPTFKAGDIGTVALTVKRFSAAGADAFRAETELGVALFRLAANGSLYLSSWNAAPSTAFGAQVLSWTSGGSGVVALKEHPTSTTVSTLSPGAVESVVQSNDLLSAALVGTVTSHDAYLVTGGTARWKVDKTTGVLSGVSTTRIGNVATPSAGTDAANKNYVDGAAASAPVQFTTRNYAINGGFDYWQRGTTFTKDPFLSATDFYAADRWYVATAATKSFGRRSYGASLLKYGIFFGRPTGGTATDRIYLVQEIDRSWIAELHGKTPRLSLYASSGGTFSGTRLEWAVYTGTAAATVSYADGYSGSPFTGTQILSGNSGTATFDGQFSTLASSPVPVNATTMAVVISYVPSGTAGAFDGAFACNVMLTPGGVPDGGGTYYPYIYAGGSLSGELPLCQRYYEKTYELTTDPATPGAAGGDLLYIPASLSVSGGQPVFGSRQLFATPKWRAVNASGDVYVYATNTGNEGNLSRNGGADISVGSTQVGGNTRNFTLLNASGGPIAAGINWEYWAFHWTCDVDIL